MAVVKAHPDDVLRGLGAKVDGEHDSQDDNSCHHHGADHHVLGPFNAARGCWLQESVLVL